MRLRPALALAAVAALLSPLPRVADAATPAQRAAAQDAVVIAVIDSGFSPYHQDYAASFMPEEARPDLKRSPDTWLPGFPSKRSFASFDKLSLTLDHTDGTDMERLHAADAKEWEKVEDSQLDAVHYRWIPGTKVIGALAFGPGGDLAEGTVYGTGGGEHGMGSASVSTGNTFGTCPQCLLVFIQYTDQESAEQALAWAGKQPWIDAITNSYGFSLGVRDRYYNGTDLVTSKAASLRGQTTFFSAGNGQEGNFVVPNTTLLSSQEGPDWMVTVGAVTTSGDDTSGAGKPADIAGVGLSYPSSYGSETVNGRGNFSGTSNATPQVAGAYGRALWEARRALSGGRVQQGGVVASGRPLPCGSARRDCELRDGKLTAAELRQRLLHAAVPGDGGIAPGGTVGLPVPVGDARYLSEGHGILFGKLGAKHDAEHERIAGPLFGRAPVLTRPEGEVDWFRVDSWCRQQIWGEWPLGAYLDETRTPLPASDPVGWPSRTAYYESCPSLVEARP
jgi:hypothetical protein